MTFEECIKEFKSCGKALYLIDFDTMTNEEIIDFILDIETDLFRARIKLERTINHK